MINRADVLSCTNCPRRQEYYLVGSCPQCGAADLMMHVKTRAVFCKQCGEHLAIPVTVPMNCAKYVQQTRFEVQFSNVTSPSQLVAVAALLHLGSAADLFRALQEGWAEISNLSLQDVYRISRVVDSTSLEMKVLPEPIVFENFEKCWNVC